jgi:hypothetical protein
MGGATPILRREQAPAAATAAAVGACSYGRDWMARRPAGGPRQPPPDGHPPAGWVTPDGVRSQAGCWSAYGLLPHRRAPSAARMYTRSVPKSNQVVCGCGVAQRQPVAAERAGDWRWKLQEPVACAQQILRASVCCKTTETTRVCLCNVQRDAAPTVRVRCPV